MREAYKNWLSDLKVTYYKLFLGYLGVVKVNFLALGSLTVGSTNIQFILKYWLDILLVYL